MEMHDASSADSDAGWETGSSCSGLGELPDSVVDQDYVAGLSLLKVARCNICQHSSDECNPIITGRWARAKKFPCWPWAQGDFTRPVGRRCKLCEVVYVMGGFNMEYPTSEQLMAQLETGVVRAEWMSCLQKLIDLINEGKVNLRLRGGKRESVMQQLATERKRVTSLQQSGGTRAVEKFRAITVEAWRRNNPGKDPITEKELMKKVRLPGKTEPELCVLQRHLPEGEYDIEVDADMRTVGC